MIEKDTAVQRVAELQDQVEQLRAQIQEARAVGTPHGEWCGWWAYWGGVTGQLGCQQLLVCMHADANSVLTLACCVCSAGCR